MGSVQCVPTLVMYPEFGPVWHGQCSVCASPSRHMCWRREQCQSEDGRWRPHVVACGGGVDSSGFLGQGGMSVCNDCYLSEGDDVLWLL